MEKKEKRKISIAFTGDVMLGRGVNEVLLEKGALYCWGNVLPLIRKADLFAINLECVVSDKGSPWITTPKVFHFRASPIAIETLQKGGVDYVSLANNHTLDYDVPAMLDMLSRLKKAEIAVAGAGSNLKEALEPAIIEKKGHKIAFLSVTDNMPEWEASNSPGINYISIQSYLADNETMARVKESIALAKKKEADLIVFSAHWGPNMRTAPSEQFISFAHSVVDLGIDIFHGHSAHVFQGIEIYKGKPILYDTGDFIDDYAISNYIDQQMIYFIHYKGGKAESVELFPVLLGYAAVNLAPKEEFQAVAKRIQERSAPFGTKIIVEREKLRISLQ